MLRNLGASGLAISVFASLSATAQNVGFDNASTQIQLRLQQEPIASRFPDDFQQFYERYGFNIRVPVNIEDASERIHMARISCEVVSSLTANGSVVGSGTALILPDSGEPVEEREVHENYRLAHWIAGDLLNGFNQTVDVPILSIAPYDVSGWTTGHCDLTFHYRPVGGGPMKIDSPKDCTLSPADDFAICSWPESELITTQRFSREGFDQSGTVAPGGN
jgi:hypothetical protein